MSITPFIPPSFLTSLPSGIWSGTGGWPVLPYLPGQTVAVGKSPQWSTQVSKSASGRERRTPYWSYPLWRFELSYEVVRHRPSTAELFAMWEFFNVLQGQYATFLFVDPTDCQILAASPATFGVGDGVTTSFTLQRQINSFSEPVWATFSPTLLDNAVAAGAHTVSGATVTFSTPPAAGHALTWYGYFYFGCRFEQDALGFEQIVAQLWAGKSVKFTSQRV